MDLNKWRNSVVFDELCGVTTAARTTERETLELAMAFLAQVIEDVCLVDDPPIERMTGIEYADERRAFVADDDDE